MKRRPSPKTNWAPHQKDCAASRGGQVDLRDPGCPPWADLIFYVLTDLLNGRETRL